MFQRDLRLSISEDLGGLGPLERSGVLGDEPCKLPTMPHKNREGEDLQKSAQSPPSRKVCRAYSALRFHDAAHVSVLVACCKSTLSEARSDQAETFARFLSLLSAQGRVVSRAQRADAGWCFFLPVAEGLRAPVEATHAL